MNPYFFVLLMVCTLPVFSQQSDFMAELGDDPSILLEPDSVVDELPPMGQPSNPFQGIKPALKPMSLADAGKPKAEASVPVPVILSTPVVTPVTASSGPALPTERRIDRTPAGTSGESAPTSIPIIAGKAAASASGVVPQGESVLAIPLPKPQLAGTGYLSPLSSQVPGTETALEGTRQAVPKTTAMPPLPGVPDVAIILSNSQFLPSKVRLKDGISTRLLFTTTSGKPAALVIERLQVQRWIAKEGEPPAENEVARSRYQVFRELSSTKVSDITIDPKPGVYQFYDALSGAAGEIVVE